MLRKFVAANGKDWDWWLPYLVFAYREVPQASTGFSAVLLQGEGEQQRPMAYISRKLLPREIRYSAMSWNALL